MPNLRATEFSVSKEPTSYGIVLRPVEGSTTAVIIKIIDQMVRSELAKVR